MHVITQRTELQSEIDSSSTVKTFLESVGRNSVKTKNTYQTGLNIFHTFLNDRHNQSIESMIHKVSNNEVNVYGLLDNFIVYLTKERNMSLAPYTLRTYLVGIRSYLAYHDIDLIPSKFKRKVRMPRIFREDEQALDGQDIRNILLNCSNRRLKAYLLVLASGGPRAVEATAIRLKDLDFSTNPTKIHIRKEYAKTRVGRDVYISNESTKFLTDWINWKYDNPKAKRLIKYDKNPDDLVFQAHMGMSGVTPKGLYSKVISEFQKLLKLAGLDERKEGMHRRKITLHSFRRFVKTVISDQTNQDYSEWFLGHKKSPYYTKKEIDRREVYSTKCMKYLTFLDYSALEATGKNIEAKLSEKEQEIQLLRQRDAMNTDAISALSDKLAHVVKEIEVLKQTSKFV